jgi:hypothetical protein
MQNTKMTRFAAQQQKKLASLLLGDFVNKPWV